jgi:hypothetical protein
MQLRRAVEAAAVERGEQRAAKRRTEIVYKRKS